MRYGFSIAGAVALAAMVVACSGQTSANKSARVHPSAPSQAQQPAQPAQKPQRTAATASTPVARATPRTLDQIGLLEKAFDRTTKPCDDFYQYACGGWGADATLDAAVPARSRVLDLERSQAARLSRLLVAASAGHPNKRVATLGAYYRSCTDEAAVLATGPAAIAPLLRAARAVKDPRSLAIALALLHRYRIWAGFTLGVAPDFKSSTQLLYLDHGALGLGERNAYLRYGPLTATRRSYRKHVARLLELAGSTKPRARRAASRVLSFETRLAQARKLRGQRRDVAGLYHQVNRAELTKLTGLFDWTTYFATLGNAQVNAIAVTTPRYFALLGKLTRRRYYVEWRAYLAFHAAQATAHMVGGKTRAEADAFARILAPGWTAPSVAARCVADTRMALENVAAQVLTTQSFGPKEAKRAAALIAGIAAGFKANAATLDWLSTSARSKTVTKLGALALLVGYPDAWQTDSLSVDAGNYARNALAARSAITARALASVGKPVSRTAWIASADTTDVIYNWLANQLTVPAGVLGLPFFDSTRARAVNLGALSLLVGNEMTHAIDQGGSLFDEAGRLGAWWTRPDEKAYAEKAACFVAQYDALTESGRQVDGRQTLRENMADLAGTRAAFRAHRAGTDGGDGTVSGLTGDQQFFVAMAQTWCGRATETESRRVMQLSTHAPARHRVNGVVSNMPAFAKSFGCAAGQPMVRAKVCSAW